MKSCTSCHQEKLIVARGWCKACHTRWLRAGKPIEGPPKPSISTRPDIQKLRTQDPEYESKIIQRYLAGESARQIALSLGRSHNFICNILADHNIPRERYKMSPDQVCKVCGGPVSAKNNTGICTKTRRCNNEHGRIYRKNPACREYGVYAVLFPRAEVVKIGKSTGTLNAFLSNNKHYLKEYGLGDPSNPAELIFISLPQLTSAGLYLIESSLQALFGFHYPPALKSPKKLSEWYKVGSANITELKSTLKKMYESLPAVPDYYLNTKQHLFHHPVNYCNVGNNGEAFHPQL